MHVNAAETATDQQLRWVLGMARDAAGRHAAEIGGRIGERIRAARRTAGLKIAEVAIRAGVPRRTLHGWERGTGRASSAQLAAVAEAVGLRLDQLVPARRPVRFDPVERTLRIGDRTEVADPALGNDGVLPAYAALVRRARRAAADTPIAIRRCDVELLAHALDLDDADLATQLARHLRVPAPHAASLGDRLRHHRFAAVTVTLAVGTLASAPLRAGAEPAPVAPPPAGAVSEFAPPLDAPVAAGPAGEAGVATVVPAAAQPTAVPTAATGSDGLPSAGADAAETETRIGETIVYERDPDFVPPPGVDIGDALVIER
ncbi:MAG: helix-turn-helix domain-containing protein [Acidimicrobiia bacterium]